MEKIIEKNNCTGCSACSNVCPKKAISMKISADGFLYPFIDDSKCIKCGLCEKKCPLNFKKNKSNNHCYVAYNKTINRLTEGCSSGGIFEIIANKVLDSGGVVIGALFENNELIHKAIYEKKELNKLKGSKYLQSDLKDIHSFIKNNVENKKILFVGTPCQVAGIKSICNHNNLITIDLFCHGVPSPKVFKKYIHDLELKYFKKIKSINFRDKKDGWENYFFTVEFKDGTTISEKHDSNVYMNLFLTDMILRKSCYNCNFKFGNKYSDITLGDFWGIKNVNEKMYQKNGVSAIIVNTGLGERIFDSIKDELFYEECDLDDIIGYNKSLICSPVKPQKREKLFKNIDKYNIYDLNHKYRKYSIITRIINKLFK